MRVSEYFSLNKTQPELDFVDVDVVNDTKIYMDPRALHHLPSEWAEECVSLVQNFFGTVLSTITAGEVQKGQRLLRQLREPNETHLGDSRGKSRGRALGDISSVDLWDALSSSHAAKSGLLEDLEDTALLVEGIGFDIVSDITTNIIREPLIQFTNDTCAYYGIPVTHQVSSGPVWNPITRAWEVKYVSLPIANGKKLLLVPKAIVRKRLEYDPQEYFQHYILEYLRELELADPRSALVELLKSGPRVTKKSLKAKYGTTKGTISMLTERYPEVLEQYRAAKRKGGESPLSHSKLADAIGADRPNYEKLLATVLEVPSGKADATKYHHAVETLLTALFYPALVNPQREFPVHEGRKRIDIKYTNAADYGFFRFLSLHYPSALIMVECKNYVRPIGNPEFDQLAGRFSPSRGKVGFLVYRRYEDKDASWRTCVDTAKDDRGFIIPLDDSDLVAIVKEHSALGSNGAFDYLRRCFERLIT